jgi:periplasmic divalent cation tolerance protein
MPEVRVILVTVPDHETALRLSRRLVQSELVACANVVPGLTSVYRWKGDVQEDSEELLILKTSARLVPKVLETVSREHPYDVPEGLVLTVAHGLEPYLAWIEESVRHPKE